MHVLEDDVHLGFTLPGNRVSDGAWSEHIANHFSRRGIATQVAGAPVAGGIAQPHAFYAARIVGRDGLAFDFHADFGMTKVAGCTTHAFSQMVANAQAISDFFYCLDHLRDIAPL